MRLLHLLVVASTACLTFGGANLLADEVYKLMTN